MRDGVCGGTLFLVPPHAFVRRGWRIPLRPETVQQCAGHCVNPGSRLLRLCDVQPVIPYEIRVADAKLRILGVQNGYGFSPVNHFALGAVMLNAAEQICWVASLVPAARAFLREAAEQAVMVADLERIVLGRQEALHPRPPRLADQGRNIVPVSFHAWQWGLAGQPRESRKNPRHRRRNPLPKNQRIQFVAYSV